MERLFKLGALNVLLVFNFFLYVLISLQQLVVLGLSELQSLVKIGLKLFLEGIHFVLLLIDKLGFGGDDLLGSLIHVLFTLLRLQLHANLLDLVCFLISIAK